MVYHHAKRVYHQPPGCIFAFAMMIYKACALMICNFFEIDDIHAMWRDVNAKMRNFCPQQTKNTQSNHSCQGCDLSARFHLVFHSGPQAISLNAGERQRLSRAARGWFSPTVTVRNSQPHPLSVRVRGRVLFPSSLCTDYNTPPPFCQGGGRIFVKKQGNS